jgi:hypothetical protein
MKNFIGIFANWDKTNMKNFIGIFANWDKTNMKNFIGIFANWDKISSPYLPPFFLIFTLFH